MEDLLNKKHFLYELNSDLQKIRTIELSGLNNIHFLDGLQSIEADHEIDIEEFLLSNI